MFNDQREDINIRGLLELFFKKENFGKQYNIGVGTRRPARPTLKNEKIRVYNFINMAKGPKSSCKE